MNLQFNIAEMRHLVDIVKLLAEDKLGATRENFKEPLPEAYVSAFMKITSDSSQELIVVENENKEVIGTLQLSFIQYLTYQGGIRAQIEAVRIREIDRGKGYGALFFQWAINRAKERGAHLLQLSSDKRRPEAIKFYEKLGFV
ncbi:GNAT family N-acetyltransferase [Flavobacterium sp. 17A]|uniref:GNAT family N-acetyltransferase n=1 Tax=Flavobacterium potami TaxID=2872310 RepID=A0A9X1HBD2_9FLAO|nr:GNAT family N-acetyltransferase [Flavobacterium potami]MBZ4035344.1 GNAT family N-acetyltransferase [Flavobacterium potami]